jgi:hypothetical protein
MLTMTMNLHITPNRLISEVQQEFNKAFAFLKLEFFSKKALLHADYSASQLVKTDKRLSEIQLKPAEGEIDVQGQMRVIDLEEKLRDQFNLAAQVFRKSGKVWLETTMTDEWTLEQQNKHGKELSTEPGKDRAIEDFDLTRDAD